MKVSRLNLEIILNHIREEAENLDEDDLILLEAMKTAAIQYVISQTGLTEKELDEHEDITIAVLTLISDMWDNRAMTIQRSNVNIVVDTILSMHRMNLVPTPDAEVI